MTYIKGIKGKADRLFSLAVRTVGRCENCNKKDNLQCAHIISRKYAKTRCSFRNAFCLCAGCHMFFTLHPLEFAEYVHSSWAGEYVESERQKAYSVVAPKIDYSERADTAQKIIDGTISIYDARQMDS